MSAFSNVISSFPERSRNTDAGGTSGRE
jgi:hypothetical protein